MWLFTLDTTRDFIHYGLYNQKIQAFFCMDSDPCPKIEHDIFYSFENFLQNCTVNLTDLNIIAAISGPGLHNNTRLGTSFASTLGWSLNIPYVSFSRFDLLRHAYKDKATPTTRFITCVRHNLWQQTFPDEAKIISQDAQEEANSSPCPIVQSFDVLSLDQPYPDAIIHKISQKQEQQALADLALQSL